MQRRDVQFVIVISVVLSLSGWVPARAGAGARRSDVAPDSKTAKAPTTASAPTEAASKVAKPQVEIFIPSVVTLVNAAKTSKTATLYAALSSLFPTPRNETGEGFDLESLVKLWHQVESWPDTSLSVAVYSQDREGRPRWLIRVDWPLEKLTEHVRSLLTDEAAKDLFKNIEVKESDDGTVRIALPEMELAVIKRADGGSMVASSASIEFPESLYGRDALKKSSEKRGSSRKKPYLAYGSLNLDAGDEDQKGSGFLSNVAGISAIRYVVTVNRKKEWNEQFGITWNPLLGAVVKAALQKVKDPFDCPRDAYVNAVIHLGLGESMADGLAGLPLGTIGRRASGEMLFSLLKGSGFLPVPDLFYSLRVKGKDEIVSSIRKAIDAESRRRAEDDLKPRWREEVIDGRTVFWRDPAADGMYGMMPISMRTVLFFDGDDKTSDSESKEADDEKSEVRLVIASTSTWADDAVRNWTAATRETSSLPTSRKVHWQARLDWRRVYDLAHPYLGVLAGFTEGASPPPNADELGDALVDSDVQLQISFGGLRVRHTGPLPIGVLAMPAAVGMALGTDVDPWSEAARERTACRNLRVLYYHAKLFKKDYGRWPATVAELDGYVDFDSHPELLYMRGRDRSFMEGLTSALFSGGTRSEKPAAAAEDRKIDDSLYVIEWSPSDEKWQLRLRDDEFANYKSIYIDAAGEIHRVSREITPAESMAKASDEKADDHADADSPDSDVKKAASEMKTTTRKSDEPTAKQGDRGEGASDKKVKKEKMESKEEGKTRKKKKIVL